MSQGCPVLVPHQGRLISVAYVSFEFELNGKSVSVVHLVQVSYNGRLIAAAYVSVMI